MSLIAHCAAFIVQRAGSPAEGPELEELRPRLHPAEKTALDPEETSVS